MDVVHEKEHIPGDFREPRKIPRTPPDFHQRHEETGYQRGISKADVWRFDDLVEVCSVKTVKFTFKVVTKGQHQTHVPPVFEVK